MLLFLLKDIFMSSLKTYFRLLIFIAALFSAPMSAQSQTAPLSDPLRTFAACAGRLSAQMEFEWMFDGPASEITKAQRSAVIDILEAMIGPDQGRDVLNWRVEAKMAHASLLTRSKFSTDRRVTLRAERLALRSLENCNALLLG